MGAAAIASVSGVGIHTAQAQSKNQKGNIEQKANELSQKLFADDGLAIPIATKPTVF